MGTAESEIVDLEEDISALEGNVSTLEGNVSALETDLAESEATVATLQSDLDIANNKVCNLQRDLSTQRNINTTLSSELKTVKDPRHFSSIQELTDWLHEDDTDTKYADESNSQKAFILQVKALRDGYLLPVICVLVDNIPTMRNMAIIGNEMYWINANDDDSYLRDTVDPIPSHPLPLD